MESLYRVKGKYMYYLGIWWIMNTREKLSKFIYSNVSVIVQHNLAQNWYFITTKCRPRRFTAPNSWWRTAEDDAALASSLFRIYSRNADFSGFFFLSLGHACRRRHLPIETVAFFCHPVSEVVNKEGRRQRLSRLFKRRYLFLCYICFIRFFRFSTERKSSSVSRSSGSKKPSDVNKQIN